VFPLGENLVNEPELVGLVGRHEVVSFHGSFWTTTTQKIWGGGSQSVRPTLNRITKLRGLTNHVESLSGMLGVEPVQKGSHLQNFTGVDFHLGSLSLCRGKKFNCTDTKSRGNEREEGRKGEEVHRCPRLAGES